MYYIGIDLGTSAVKLLLMEESGKICNIVSREYPLFFPHPGWSEQKPEDWFAQSMEGMKELTKSSNISILLICSAIASACCGGSCAPSDQ